MYRVPDNMSQYSTREQIDPAHAQNPALSPELREVMHLLNAIEKSVTTRSSDTSR